MWNKSWSVYSQGGVLRKKTWSVYSQGGVLRDKSWHVHNHGGVMKDKSWHVHGHSNVGNATFGATAAAKFTTPAAAGISAAGIRRNSDLPTRAT